MTDKVVPALHELRISTMSNLLCEGIETFKNMKVPTKVKNSAGDKTTVLKAVHQSTNQLVPIFIDFCHYLNAKQGANIDWLAVTEQEFNDFRILPEYINTVNPPPGTTHFSPGPNPMVIVGSTSPPVPPTTTKLAAATNPTKPIPTPRPG